MCNHIIRRIKFCENRKKFCKKTSKQKTRKNSQITQKFQTKIRKNTANPRKRREKSLPIKKIPQIAPNLQNHYKFRKNHVKNKISKIKFR